MVLRKFSREVSRYSPSSSDLSEKAMACTTKSSVPQASFRVSKTASMLASSVTSQGSTSSERTDSASGLTRRANASPWYVNANSAPCAAQALAMPQAIERSLATPMINPRLPAIRGEGTVMRLPRNGNTAQFGSADPTPMDRAVKLGRRGLAAWREPKV